MSFVACTKCFCCNDAEFRSREMYLRLTLCKAIYIVDITINNQPSILEDFGDCILNYELIWSFTEFLSCHCHE